MFKLYNTIYQIQYNFRIIYDIYTYIPKKNQQHLYVWARLWDQLILFTAKINTIYYYVRLDFLWYSDGQG